MKVQYKGTIIPILERLAANSTCRRKQVGSFILNTDTFETIGTGWNHSAPNTEQCCEKNCNEFVKCTNTIHAEINAIYSAAKNGKKCDGGLICVTHFPCINCSKAIVSAGIKTVYYVEDYGNNESYDYLIKNGIIVLRIQPMEYDDFDEISA